MHGRCHFFFLQIIDADDCAGGGHTASMPVLTAANVLLFGVGLARSSAGRFGTFGASPLFSADGGRTLTKDYHASSVSESLTYELVHARIR